MNEKKIRTDNLTNTDKYKLKCYRDLFNTIAKSDKNIEYSGEELISYFIQIENGKWRL